MHLLTAQAGTIDDGSEPVDLGQSPAAMVVLSAADTEIAALARAKAELGDAVPSLRLAPLLQLGHSYSVDLYLERTLRHARLVVLRLIGGPAYWRYGTDEVVRLARGSGMALAVLSGTQDFDPEVSALSTVSEEACRRLFAYLAEGGPQNYRNALLYAAHLIGAAGLPGEPRRLPRAAIHGVVPAASARPRAAVVFYRALLQGSDLAPVDALCEALRQEGLDPVPIHVSGLRDPEAAQFVDAALAEANPDVVVNATAFAVSGEAGRTSPLDRPGAPVLQVAFAGVTEQAWAADRRGLGPRDLAMHVALPEMDGRIFTRAVSFKGESRFDSAVETRIVAHHPRPDRIAFVARLAGAWSRLRRTNRADRRIAIVLSNYPSGDARIANALGLDALESTVELLRALRQAGYSVSDIPDSGDALASRLLAGPTGPGNQGTKVRHRLDLRSYEDAVSRLPERSQRELAEGWGGPDQDTLYRSDLQAFAIPALRFGNVAVLLQPARGDAEAYHDPTRAPPHGYVAAYLWVRHVFSAHALVHMGAHGSLEWLPGKALALSEECWPELLLGPMPLVYPFIVNNPGEAAQAKRRTAAITISHLTPPMRRGALAGRFRDLEALADEYAQAAGLDRRRADLLAQRLIEAAREARLDRDLGLDAELARDEMLRRLDAFLCELKERPIRDGLHVFGRPPAGDAMAALVAFLEECGCRNVQQALEQSAMNERNALLAALDGRLIPPGPSGAPSRGRADMLPTGRNMYGIDPRVLPTEAAFDLGRRAAEELVTAYVQEQGRYPERIALSAWGTSAIRTGGDDIAQVLALIGARPVRDPHSRRVAGFEVLPLSELKRPRVDVVLRVSGFFRDGFPTQIDLIASAIRAIARRDEPAGANPIRDHALAEQEKLQAQGLGPDAAFAIATRRIFSSAPGTFGAGVKQLVESGEWETRTDLARAYLAAGAFTCGSGLGSTATPDLLEALLARTSAVLQAQDAREFDLLDSDEHVDFTGGLAAAVQAFSGAMPAVYHADSSDPRRLRVRRLGEEIALVVRGRASDPRWTASCRRHGYRGAGELVQAVTALFGFAATTGLVPDSAFEALHEATLEDPETRAFLEEKNPAALRAIAARFAEAVDRGLWSPRRNSLRADLHDILAEAA